MKKLSNMGGGEFEYIPQALEEKISKRYTYLFNDLESIKHRIDTGAKTYMQLGLGSLEGYKEYIIRELVKDLNNINGGV